MSDVSRDLERAANWQAERLTARCYNPSSGRSRSRTSSTSAPGDFPANSARRCFQSKLFTWSQSTAPETGSPEGMSDSKGYPFTWLVMGQASARVWPLLFISESAARTPALGIPVQVADGQDDDEVFGFGREEHCVGKASPWRSESYHLMADAMSRRAERRRRN